MDNRIREKDFSWTLKNVFMYRYCYEVYLFISFILYSSISLSVFTDNNTSRMYFNPWQDSFRKCTSCSLKTFLQTRPLSLDSRSTSLVLPTPVDPSQDSSLFFLRIPCYGFHKCLFFPDFSCVSSSLVFSIFTRSFLIIVSPIPSYF